jgi:predicted nuclease of predicted toxin-antitoxin system
MKIRYQADADLNIKIVVATVRLNPGVDFRTADAASLTGVTDSRVLEIAAEEGRILVTHDKSTMPGHFAEFVQTRESPGVFVVRRGLKLAEIAEELVMIWEASEPGEWVNQISYLPL